MLVALLLIPVAASAQEPPHVPYSIYLQEKGYSTRDDVVRALSDRDPHTRGVAALRLSELHDPQAVPLVNGALAAEKDDAVKIDYASALLSLGDESGRRLLENFCGEGASTPAILRSATLQLTLRNRGGACADRVVAAYVLAKNGSERNQWIDVLTAVCKDASPTRGASSAAREALQEELNAETDTVLKWRIREALRSRVFATPEQP